MSKVYPETYTAAPATRKKGVVNQVAVLFTTLMPFGVEAMQRNKQRNIGSGRYTKLYDANANKKGDNRRSSEEDMRV
jgi:hypothetical protein